MQTKSRAKPDNVKRQVIRRREFEHMELKSEQVAEFDYQPIACERPYRMVVIRKNISHEKGDKLLFDEIRYFFYITNDRAATATEIVFGCNDRCDQENLIAQIAGGVRALSAPVDSLVKGLAKKPEERFESCSGMLDGMKSTSGNVTSGNTRLRSQRPESGQSTVRYESASLSELQRLAVANDSMAQFILGKKFRTGDGVAKDSKQAYRLIRSAAESCHAEAQLILGAMSMQGEGTLKSEKEGHRWNRLSAENGWPEAQYAMYINLWYGDDEDSRPEAVEWLQKSAANRYASAADALAGIYSGLEEVDFIEPDDEQAVYWQQVAMEAYYIDATEKNDASAQYSLGLAYDSSITPGVDEDPSQAAKWFALAADQGHKRAMHKLAWCYCRGKGVSQDGQRALALFKAAADLGDIDSENAIGLMYQSGYGVKANLETAAKWYRIAISHGHSAAKHNLKNIGYGDDEDDDDRREPPKPKGWFDSLFG